MDITDKLELLADAAKYDVACTSSGVGRVGQKGKLGNTSAAGICHSFTADGRCITLLKVLLSNACIYNCAYCVNRISNEGTRTTFKPRELADLTISFYRRNYIEGLFLSSGVVRSPDFTTELMIEALSSKFVRNSDGVRPADCGGLSDDEDFALSNYNAFKVAAGKTLKSIIISCNVRLKPLSIREVRELLTYDEMKLDTLGDRFVTVTDENGKTVVTDEPRKRTIIYGILSDTDRTFAFLFAIMMWQTIDQLCRKALDVYNGKLPNLVNFILDEFANIGEIPDVEKTIAVTRSRSCKLLSPRSFKPLSWLAAIQSLASCSRLTGRSS